MKLTELEVLTLDCQATAANPQKGHLLEIGWVQSCAAATIEPEALTAEACLVALPEKVGIPPAVQRVTGITRADAERALPAADIRLKLSRTAKRVADLNQKEKCPYHHSLCPF